MAVRIEEKARYFELRRKLVRGDISELEAIELKALNEKLEREAKNRMEKHITKITRLMLEEVLMR